MRLTCIASKIASDDSPLEDWEKKLLPKAAVFAMDWECDGGTIPDDAQPALDGSKPRSYRAERSLVKWFLRTAPGDF